MKQYINFYRPKATPVDPSFSGNKMVRMWTGTAVILVIISLSYVVMKHIATNKLAHINQENQAAQAQLQGLMQALAAKQDVTALENEEKALHAERDGKQKMIELLKKEGLEDVQGFAAKLEELSEQHVSGTWYTAILLHNGGRALSFEGKAVDPKLVPKIVQDLGGTRSFQNKSFEYILVEKPKDGEDDYVTFVLQTEARTAVEDQKKPEVRKK